MSGAQDALEQRPVGLTRPRVTALGFGGASAGNLGQETTDADSATAVDRARAGGIRYFDTAPHYGLGLSERRLGAALPDRPRELFVISTKVGRMLEPNPRPAGSDLAAGGSASRSARTGPRPEHVDVAAAARATGLPRHVIAGQVLSQLEQEPG